MKRVHSFSKLSSALILGGLITFTSCKKDNSATDPAATTDSVAVVDVVQSDAGAAAQFDDVFNITMGVQASDAGEDVGIGSGAGVIYKPASPDGITSPDSTSRCFTVTVAPKTLHVFPKTVTIDFGTGCLGKDGKLRKGKIITIYSGPMFMAGNTASTTFVDYSVDSFKIEGTHSIQNTSATNELAWTVKVVGGKITNTQSGHWRTWDAARTTVRTEGNGTPFNPLDDVFKITGNSSGSNSNGNSWTSLITDSLVRRFTCPWIEKGQVKITWNSNTNPAILDFGDGTCDDKATITYKNFTKIITLH